MKTHRIILAIALLYFLTAPLRKAICQPVFRKTGMPVKDPLSIIYNMVLLPFPKNELL